MYVIISLVLGEAFLIWFFFRFNRPCWISMVGSLLNGGKLIRWKRIRDIRHCLWGIFSHVVFLIADFIDQSVCNDT